MTNKVLAIALDNNPNYLFILLLIFRLVNRKAAIFLIFQTESAENRTWKHFSVRYEMGFTSAGEGDRSGGFSVQLCQHLLQKLQFRVQVCRRAELHLVDAVIIKNKISDIFHIQIRYVSVYTGALQRGGNRLHPARRFFFFLCRKNGAFE